MKYTIANWARRKIGKIAYRYNDTSTPSPKEIKRLIRKLRAYFKKHRRPKYFAAVGYSGCAIGTTLSVEFDIPLILLRNGHPYREAVKNNPKKKIITREISTNNGLDVEKGATYFFVDDLMDTGITFARMFSVLSKKKMKCIGIGVTSEWGASQGTVDVCFAKGNAPKLKIIEG